MGEITPVDLSDIPEESTPTPRKPYKEKREENGWWVGKTPDLETPKPEGYEERVLVVAFSLWVRPEDMEGDFLVDFARERMTFPEGPRNYPNFREHPETYLIRDAKLVRELQNARIGNG